MGGWSCPYQTKDMQCQRVKIECDPGMKGCVLRGKVVSPRMIRLLIPLKNPPNPEKPKENPQSNRTLFPPM